MQTLRGTCMPRWTLDELEQQWAHYQKVARRCGPSGDWDEFVDLYTEDAVMIVSGAGKIGGREAMRRWYREAFATQPHAIARLLSCRVVHDRRTPRLGELSVLESHGRPGRRQRP